jgi:hypothetical protein
MRNATKDGSPKDVDFELGDPEGEKLDEAEKAPAKERAQAGTARIKKSDYNRKARAMALYLEQQEAAGLEMTEEDLVAWYVEQEINAIGRAEDMRVDEITHIEELGTLLIKRLIDRDKVFLETMASDNPDHPQLRKIQKHPDYVPEEIMETTPFQTPAGAAPAAPAQDAPPENEPEGDA